MGPATGSICLGDHRIDRHHLIIKNTQSIIPSSWSQALLPSIHRFTHNVWFFKASDPSNLSRFLPTLLSPELLFLSNLLRMLRELHRFTALCSCQLRDAMGGYDQVSLEMELEAEIEETQRCTWQPWLNQFQDALQDHDQTSLERHMEAEIARTDKCTLRPSSTESGDALQGHDPAILDIQLRPWSSEIPGVLGGGQCGAGRSGGRHDWSWEFSYLETSNFGNVKGGVEQDPQRDKRWETGWACETVNGRMMQYFVYAVLGINSWSWNGQIERDESTSCA